MVLAATAAAWLLSGLVGLANGLASTDTITWGGDNSRSGYQANHNMDPAIVRSSQFDQIFRTELPGNYGGVPEQIFSQPLVYTLSDTQYVYLSTTQNNVYKIDALTGDIVASRDLHIPFLVEDLDGCTDINPHIGVTGTGVIDPDTDTYYILAKTYEDQSQINVAQGKPAGRFYLHALDVNDLSERPNFPVPLEGIVARNNPTRVFNGGIHLQRPGLLHTGQWIYAGLGSHCVQYNFTGWVMGWDKETGEFVEQFATQGDGVPNDIEGAGIWMSGGGLASDNAGSIFFATGNGYASQLADVPVNGRDPPTALEQAVVHMTQQDDGSLEIVDFFMPEEKRELDGADRDLGTSPVQILPSEFSCGDVSRIGMVTGKSGKTYWLNLDDLGGYRNGGIGLDDVLQVYQHENSVYAGAGVYPLEGGYVYVNPVRYPTIAFRFSCSNGVPSFSRVGEAPEANAYTLGVSHGTVTSLDGQPGTGLMWLTDVQNPPGQLRIYDAVPRDGELELIKSWEIPGVTKFTRAVFGDGIMYMGSTNGLFHAFGAPINAPINCTSPFDFGNIDLESSGDTETLTCTALIDVEVSEVALRDDTDFSISSVPSLPLSLSEGETFSVQATFSPTDIGLLSTDITIESENGIEGFRTTTSIRLLGTGQSETPRLSVSPRSISFDNVIAGNGSVPPNNVILTNQGNTGLTISEILYSSTINGSFESFNPEDGTLNIGPYVIRNLPSTIDANSGATVSVGFDPSTAGEYAGHVRIVSDGGNGEFTISGWAGAAPVALIEFQVPDGSGWVTYEGGQNFTFGNVTEGTTRSLRMRVSNTAPSGSVRLSLTVSKPPFGSGLIRANNQVDLGEGTDILPGDSASAVLYCNVPRRQWNMEPYDAHATWSMNTNDPDFLYHVIDFACNAVSRQAPPLLDNGLGQYRYLGCYKENNPGRQLESQLYGDDNNTIPMCIDSCHEGDYVFCGTQYHRECWAGQNIPRERVADANCNFDCSGDLNSICGGNGAGELSGGSFISLFADTLRFDGNETDLPEPPQPSEPVVNPGVNGYVSIGCYTEAPVGRALPYLHDTEQQTVGRCIDACADSSYSHAGLQYGGECWCGNEFTDGVEVVDLSECSMLCNGNGTEYCGGPSRLNVYRLVSEETPVTSSSIVDESRTASSSAPTSISETSSIPSEVATSSILSDMTSSASEDISSAISSEPESSVPSMPSGATTSSEPTSSSAFSSTASSFASSSSPSSTAAPTPVKTERIGNWVFQGCYTEGDGIRALTSRTFADDDMTLDACADFCEGTLYFGTEYGRECYCGDEINGGSDLADDQDDCYFPCGGDGSQFCGAGDRLELYRDEGAAGDEPSADVSGSTTSDGVSGTTSLVEFSSSGATSASTSMSTSLEVSSSVVTASSGISSSSEASTLSASVSSESESLASSSSSSSSSYSSSSFESSSSSIASSSSTPTPTPTIYPGNEEYVYAGCYSEPSHGRLLPRQPLNDGDDMDVDLCLKTCEEEEKDYAGIQYGRECWCGDELNLEGDERDDVQVEAGELVDDDDCHFVCPGNATQFCGAGVRLSVYVLREVAEEVDGGIGRSEDWIDEE